MNKLGWHWWPSDTTVATMDYEGRARCINLGHCTPACAQGAKASTDITYWPHAIRAGVELKTHCRVREILTNEDGMASGVVYYDKDGVEQFQPAEVVIIACNGVGTPRLLLNSVSGTIPERPCQFIGPGRQEPDVPSLCADLRLRRGADGRQPRAADLPVEQGVLRHGSVARLRPRLRHPVRPRRRAGVRGRRKRAEGHSAVGRGSSPRLPQAQRPSHRRLRDLRGSAGGAQPGHARSGAEGRPRHSGAADRLHHQRKQPRR